MNRTFARNAAPVSIAMAMAASCATGEHPAIPRLEAPPARASFDAALVERGAQLAAIGDCRGCHTAEGGRAFAGGLPLATPFGTIYTSNITPDPETGIGRWSEEAFRRAMREGVGRGGRHLYPAFPYDRFTLVTDADDRALYAYVMTRPAVRNRPPPDRLAFPFNVRSFLAIWKKLYFRPGPYQPDSAHDAQWNRGAYLSEGLGHCGSCHTPRNALGAELRDRHLDGGEAEGWHAYAINARSNAPTPWSVDSMSAYLRDGWQAAHGVARGPMASVAREMAHASEADLRAISAYIVSLMGDSRAPAQPGAQARAQEDSPAARLYAGACAQCHDGSQPLPFGGIGLARSIGVSGESPRNLMNVILYGLPAGAGETAPIMPGYAGAISDAQLVDLVAFLRARFSARPPWEDVERAVREARAAGAQSARQVAGGAGTDPAFMREAR